MPFDILHATTNQKHAGVTEGGWDRMRDQAGTLGECVSIILGLLSTPKCGNIADDNNKYAIGNKDNDKPLAKGNNDNNVPIAATSDGESLVDDVDNKYAKGNGNDKYAKGKF
jgi:hypothetical protein